MSDPSANGSRPSANGGPSLNGVRPSMVRDRPDAMVFSKTISEADVYAFAGITGDFYPAHVDAVYAATQPAGERIAHGILLMGLMSTAAARWMMSEAIDGISYGYDKVRFIRPVLFGDTITVAYAWESDSQDGQKIFASVEAHNQRGEMVGTARHIVWIL